MNQLLANLSNLGRGRLITLAGAGVGIVLALLFGMSALLAPTYRTLYTDLTPSSASGIVTALEQAGFSPKVSADSAMVSVPEDDLARARMVVASAGLARDGAAGWELFDETSGIGMNSFMQRVNRLRALEGELARSIQSLDGVDSARVHVVLPEREAFSRDAPEPTASVIVRRTGGGRISRNEAIAIRSLVSSAVPDLDPGAVVVTSATGEVILAAEDGAAGVDAGIDSRRAEMERRMARSIETILGARVGAGNVRVQVSAELSNRRRVTMEESYDPDQQVARSVETLEEQAAGQDAGADQVGVQGNIPAGLGGDEAGGGASESSERLRERTEFEIGSVRSETVIEPGDVERISVAVLVNGIYEENGTNEPDYTARAAEEIARLEQLVKSAVGFSESRGDEVSIDSMRFMDYSMALGDPSRATISQKIAENIPFILRLAFALVVVALMLIFAVRPALNRIFPDQNAIADNRDETPALQNSLDGATDADGQPTGTGLAVTPDAASKAQLPKAVDTNLADVPSGDETPQADDYVRINSVKGLVTRNKIDAVRRTATDESDAVVAVLRGWLNQKA